MTRIINQQPTRGELDITVLTDEQLLWVVGGAGQEQAATRTLRPVDTRTYEQTVDAKTRAQIDLEEGRSLQVDAYLKAATLHWSEALTDSTKGKAMEARAEAWIDAIEAEEEAKAEQERKEKEAAEEAEKALDEDRQEQEDDSAGDGVGGATMVGNDGASGMSSYYNDLLSGVPVTSGSGGQTVHYGSIGKTTVAEATRYGT